MSYSSILNMAISGIIPSLLISIFIYFLYWRTQHLHNFPLFIFVLYLIMLFYVTIYRYGLSISEVMQARPTPNFIPLILTYRLSIFSGWDIFFYNIVGNIMWFVPFGILLPFIKKLYFKDVFIWSFSLSFGIEIAQFVLNCGISDIDDVIFNVLGGCIGYVFYKAMKKMS